MNKRISRLPRLFFGIVCLLGLRHGPVYAQSIGVSGVVRDAQGHAVMGAAVTLQCGENGSGASVLKAESNVDGGYMFTVVPALVCRLQAVYLGLTANREIDLMRATAAHTVLPELVLAPASVHQSAPVATSTPPTPPTFEASGIRGLIDPGGYSAPANAAAASSLLSGMADVRRTDSVLGGAPATQPCTALPILLRSVQVHTDDSAANRELGSFYLTHGQSKQALPYLKAAQQIAPGDAGVTTQLARAEIAEEQFAAARGTLAALPTETQSAETHALMAQALEGLTRFPEAAEQYRLAQEHSRSIENIFGQGYELILAVRLPAAEEAFRNGLRLFPHSTRLLIGRGIAEYLESHNAESVATFLEAVAADPGDAQAYPFLAQAYLVSGENADRVRLAMRNYLTHASDSASAYYLLAQVLSRSTSADAPADDAEVEALLRKAIALNPNYAPAHFRLGIMLARRDENEAAARELKQALRLQPTLAEAHFRLSSVDRKLGRSEAAAEEMAIFQRVKPSGDVHDAQAGFDFRQFVSVLHRSEPNPFVETCR